MIIFKLTRIETFGPLTKMDHGIILNTITALSSNKTCTLVIDKHVIIKDGREGFHLVNVGYDKDVGFILKDIYHFTCCQARSLSNYLYNTAQPDDLIILLTSGTPFFNRKYMQAIKSFQEIGAGIKYFSAYSNYILIGTKSGGVCYEKVSEEPVLYPHINITDAMCVFNPISLVPPKKYLFWTMSPNEESIRRCALEAKAMNFDRFGLIGNYCIPISSKQFENVIRYRPKKGDCFNDTGNSNHMSVYQVTSSLTGEQVIQREQAVEVYEYKNFKGRKKILSDGEHLTSELLSNVGSVIIPRNYFVYLVNKNDNHAKTFYGPQLLNDTTKDKLGYRAHKIVVKQVRDDSVIFCESDNGMGRCYTYGVGKHTLPPYLFFTIRYVNMRNADKVYLYNNLGFSEKDLIEVFDKNNNTTINKVQYPRSTYAVVVV